MAGTIAARRVTGGLACVAVAALASVLPALAIAGLLLAILVAVLLIQVGRRLPDDADAMWAIPLGTILFSFFFPAFFLGCAINTPIYYVFAADFFFTDTAPRRGPLRVRAFVRVRWPCTGSPRRWRMPR